MRQNNLLSPLSVPLSTPEAREVQRKPTPGRSCGELAWSELVYCTKIVEDVMITATCCLQED